jgi:uncharacterized protein YfaT (DUF1175 family)
MRNAMRALTPAIALVLAVCAALGLSAHAAILLVDDTDRSAFRSWFTFLADAQFERTADDVVDCASLVRHAYREALRPHSPEWYRRSRLPVTVAFPDVRHAPPARDGAWLLFRVARDPERFAEFADAATLIRFNTRLIGRDTRAAEPGDLLYFRQEAARSPHHLMIFVGESRFDGSRRDWIVYDTGPDGSAPGEVRKVSLADLARHPSPVWRPVPGNPAFAGVFRLAILDRER